MFPHELLTYFVQMKLLAKNCQSCTNEMEVQCLLKLGFKQAARTIPNAAHDLLKEIPNIALLCEAICTICQLCIFVQNCGMVMEYA